MVSGLEQAFMQGDFTKVYKHLKKENSHYEGSQFQIWLMYGNILTQTFADFFIYILKPYFPQETMNWPRLTPIYENDADW